MNVYNEKKCPSLAKTARGGMFRFIYYVSRIHLI